jgi:hypothetical protein
MKLIGRLWKVIVKASGPPSIYSFLLYEQNFKFVGGVIFQVPLRLAVPVL